MRTPAILTAAMAATFAVGLAAPALAHPAQSLAPAAPDAGYTSTDNVEHLGRFAEHTGTAGGRVVDDRFYLTDPRGVFVYDTSTPAEPELLGSLALPQSSTGAALAQEDPDTDGEILLVDAVDPTSPSITNRLQVVDVSDPANMEVLGSASVTDHTWTCVSTPDDGCAYAYGRSGNIVDLTDPTDPLLASTSWREHVGLNEPNDAFGNRPYTHDLTEFRTGRVMSAGAHNVLMDSTDPTAPVALNDLEVDYHTFGYHSVEWPNEGRDAFLVAGTEIAPEGPTNTAGSDCQGEGSWISTYDASSVRKADGRPGDADGLWRRAGFERIDTYRVEDRGIFLDGNAPGHTLYCAHWMELAPSFDDGGNMVVAYYDWGTRFVDIDDQGHMEEIGWFVPVDGYTGSAQWITDEIVYVMDYRRGMDVLRLTGDEATGTTVGGVDSVATEPTDTSPGIDLGALGGPLGGSGLVAGIGLGLFALASRRRPVPA